MCVQIKRPVDEPLASKKVAVDQLLHKLALAPCQDVNIGGVSGGQAKRTNIGIALITNPRVLFLDEPTSGLDSYTSNEVRCLRGGGIWQACILCLRTQTGSRLANHVLPSHCAPRSPLQVMAVVKQLVYGDVTICATIHSPTSCCFSLFDKLMMLVRGQVVYFGKGGSAMGGGRGRQL